jgi:hypothetical protein
MIGAVWKLLISWVVPGYGWILMLITNLLIHILGLLRQMSPSHKQTVCFLQISVEIVLHLGIKNGVSGDIKKACRSCGGA